MSSWQNLLNSRNQSAGSYFIQDAATTDGVEINATKIITKVAEISNLSMDTVSSTSGDLTLTSTGGSVVSSSKLKVTDTTESTDKDTGSVIVEGGVGIEKNLNVGGTTSIIGQLTVPAVASASGNLVLNPPGNVSTSRPIVCTNTATSSSTSTGAVIVSGGLGVAGSVNIGGDIVMSSAANLKTNSGAINLNPTSNVVIATGKPLICGGPLTVQSATASTTTGTGAAVITGGVGIGGNLNVGGNMTIGGTYAPSSISTGTITVTGTTQSTDPLNGAVTIAGGVGIAKQLNIQGNINASANISVNGVLLCDAIQANNDLTLVPGTGDVSTAARYVSSNTTSSTSSGTGALVVAGGAGIAGAINAGGTLTTSSTLTVGTGTAQAQGARFVLGGSYAAPDATGWAYTAANRFLISSATGNNARGVSIGINDTSNIAYIDVTSPNVAWCGLTINCGTYTLNNVSEDRLKEDVALVDHVDVSRKFRKMKFKSYNLKSEAKERCEGYMASELQETFPELVSVNADGNRMVNYWGLMLKLFPLYQDLAERVEQLESALNMQGGVEAQSIQEIPTRKRKRKSAPSE